jgi:hypothetical protein
MMKEKKAADAKLRKKMIQGQLNAQFGMRRI